MMNRELVATAPEGASSWQRVGVADEHAAHDHAGDQAGGESGPPDEPDGLYRVRAGAGREPARSPG